MFDKVILYLKALLFLCVTICFVLGADYKVLESSGLALFFYCLILGNLLIWDFYYLHKFYEIFKDWAETEGKKEIE